MRRGSGEVQFALHAGATEVLIDAEPRAREGCHVMRAPPGIGRPVRGMGLVGIKCELRMPATAFCDVLQRGGTDGRRYGTGMVELYQMSSYACMHAC